MADVNINFDNDFGTFQIGDFSEIYDLDFGDEDFNSLVSTMDFSDILDNNQSLNQYLSTTEGATDGTVPKEIKEELNPGKSSIKPDAVTSGRFATVGEADLDSIFLDGRAKSTLRTTHWGVKIFKQWLTQHEKSDSFESLPKEELSSCLRHFYAEVRTTDGNFYAKSSYVGIRSSIHRHLRAPPFERNVNILQDKEFHSANNVFVGMLKKIKKMGLDNAQHHDPISEVDLTKVREHLSVNLDCPSKLQQKVWFDLTLGFGRRGNENQRNLKLSSFEVQKDDAGSEFITMTHSEVTKNHQGDLRDTAQSKPRIYATNTASCPVASFKKYSSKLHPGNVSFFQYPRKTVTASDEFWYTLKPVGHNVLTQMMKTISKEAGLSKIYTNHCVRATTVTLLSHAGVEAREIIKLTGHKNEQSLMSYNTDSSIGQKRYYSSILQGSNPPSNQVELASVSNSLQMASSVSSAASAALYLSNCTNVTVNNFYRESK